MFKRKPREPRELGYTVINPGNPHVCALPYAKSFSPGAVIRCDCGRIYEYFDNWAGGPDWMERR